MSIKSNIKKILRDIDIFYFNYLKFIEHYNKKRYLKSIDNHTTLKLIAKDYYKYTGEKLNNPPKTYTEKIQYVKVYDITKEKSDLSDKYLARKWVKDKIGEEFLIPLLGVWDSFDEIDFTQLPNQFVLKTNNASGTNIIVKDKSLIDMRKMRKKMSFWMEQNFAFAGKGFELQYNYITPKIIAEKYIEDSNGELNDFKFLCFNGKPFYCWVDVGRTTDHRRNVYSMDWELQEWNQFSYSNTDYSLGKPKNFDQMVELATILSTGFSHVRVDLYNVDGTIYFGEMTFTNGKGYELIYPHNANEMLGELWKEEFETDD